MYTRTYMCIFTHIRTHTPSASYGFDRQRCTVKVWDRGQTKRKEPFNRDYDF